MAVLAGSADHLFYAFDASTSEQFKTLDTGAQITSSPFIVVATLFSTVIE